MNEQLINVKFVEEVEKHPCLYNYDLPEYSRKDVIEKTWNDIGNLMNMSGTACRNKWKNLRTVFMRHIKVTPTASGKKKKPYYLLDVMQFLLPYTKPANYPESRNQSPLVDESESSCSHLQEENDMKIEPNEQTIEYIDPNDMVQETNDNSNEAIPLNVNSFIKNHSKQRDTHVMEYLKSQSLHFGQPYLSTTCDDPIKLFLLSLLPELSEMNSTQLKTFKRKVFVLIDNIMDAS